MFLPVSIVNGEVVRLNVYFTNARVSSTLALLMSHVTNCLNTKKFGEKEGVVRYLISYHSAARLRKYFPSFFGGGFFFSRQLYSYHSPCVTGVTTAYEQVIIHVFFFSEGAEVFGICYRFKILRDCGNRRLINVRAYNFYACRKEEEEKKKTCRNLRNWTRK